MPWFHRRLGSGRPRARTDGRGRAPPRLRHSLPRGADRRHRRGGALPRLRRLARPGAPRPLRARGRADPMLGRRRPRGRGMADPTLAQRRPQGRGAWPALAPAPGIRPRAMPHRRTGPRPHDLGPLRAARRAPLPGLGRTDRRGGCPLQMAVRAADARPGRRRDSALRGPGVRRPAGGGDLSGMSKAETDRIRPPFAWWLLPTCALLPRPRARLAAQALLAPLPHHLPRTGW